MDFQLEVSLLIWGSFWKGLAFGSRLLVSFLLRGKIWLKSILEKWAIFGQCALRHQSRWFQSVTILELVFLAIEKVWQIWSCSKTWCIPNYQLTVFFENSSFFCCLIFEEFEKKFLNQKFYDQLLEQAWSKGSFDFSKIVPLGVPRSLIQMVSKRQGMFIEMDLLPTVITNSFQIQNQTFEKHFHFFSMTLWSWNIFLFRNISKIPN